jgi:LacI family transcriptional regulator
LTFCAFLDYCFGTGYGIHSIWELGMTKVTIQQVAKEAGVSKGTVSRVLNGRDDVNAQTRASVLEIVDRMGYVPDPGARQLARRGRHVIGLALDDEAKRGVTYYGILRDALEERLAAEGYATQIVMSQRHEQLEREVDGLILLGVHLDDPRPKKLEREGIPFAMVGRSLEHQSWVDIDNMSGMQQSVKHLTALGHRRIMHLNGAGTGQASVQRLEGYRAGIFEAGLEFDQALVYDGDFTELGGYRAVRRALGRGLEFTAIAAASDEMALGALAALDDANLRVPWHVSVTGFDDLSMAARAELTTIRQPIRDIGLIAADLLLERMAGGLPRSAIVPTQLVVRNSTAASQHHQ